MFAGFPTDSGHTKCTTASSLSPAPGLQKWRSLCVMVCAHMYHLFDQQCCIVGSVRSTGSTDPRSGWRRRRTPRLGSPRRKRAGEPSLDRFLSRWLLEKPWCWFWWASLQGGNPSSAVQFSGGSRIAASAAARHLKLLGVRVRSFNAGELRRDTGKAGIQVRSMPRAHFSAKADFFAASNVQAKKDRFITVGIEAGHMLYHRS